MKKLWVLIAIMFTLINAQYAQKKQKYVIDKAFPLEDYNFVLGTQGIGGGYQFTKQENLLEQAQQIRSMGSNILKISMGPKYWKTYKMEKDESIKTTLDLIKTKKVYQEVLDMDFKYIFTWVHSLTGIKWAKPLAPEQKMKLYREIYDLTTYFLTEYNNSGKIFMIGNWEGDWLLHGSGKRNIIPSDEKTQAMTEWFTIRQAAIDDAKKATAHFNVDVIYYVELNLALKGMEGKRCIAESILEKVNPDMVSYSSYEAIKKKPDYETLRDDLAEVMDYIESKLEPKKGIPFERRVYVGEYGYQINKYSSIEKQTKLTKWMMMATLELNMPFALHWQLYNNEYTKDGVSKGMSLISQAGEKKPVYYLHQDYYKAMNSYLKAYKGEQGIYPSQVEFNKKGLTILKDL